MRLHVVGCVIFGLVLQACGSVHPQMDQEAHPPGDASEARSYILGSGSAIHYTQYVVASADFRKQGIDEVLYFHRNDGLWRYARMENDTTYWSIIGGGGPCSDDPNNCAPLGFILHMTPPKAALLVAGYSFKNRPPTYWYLTFSQNPTTGSLRVVWKELRIEGVGHDSAVDFFRAGVVAKVYVDDEATESIVLNSVGTEVYWRARFEEDRETLIFSQVSQTGPFPGKKVSPGYFSGKKNQELFSYNNDQRQWVLGTWSSPIFNWSKVHVASAHDGLDCRPCNGIGNGGPFGVHRLLGQNVVDSSMWLFSDGEIWSAAYFLGGMFWDRIAKVNNKEVTIRTGDIWEEDSHGGFHDEVIIYNFVTGRWSIYYVDGTEWRKRDAGSTNDTMGRRSYIHYHLNTGRFFNEQKDQILYLQYGNRDIWIGRGDSSSMSLGWTKLKRVDE